MRIAELSNRRLLCNRAYVKLLKVFRSYVRAAPRGRPKIGGLSRRLLAAGFTEVDRALVALLDFKSSVAA